MKTYIALLRCVNMGGKNRMKMESLRKCFEDFGFENVVTYIQSGNVVFNGNNIDTLVWEEKIANRLHELFGFEVPVGILKFGKLKQLFDNNPFVAMPGKNPAFFHATVLFSKPQDYDREAITKKIRDTEQVIISEHAVYLYCPNGYSETKLTNSFLEKQLKVKASTRNWNTISKLLQIANDRLPE